MEALFHAVRRPGRTPQEAEGLGGSRVGARSFHFVWWYDSGAVREQPLVTRVPSCSLAPHHAESHFIPKVAETARPKLETFKVQEMCGTRMSLWLKRRLCTLCMHRVGRYVAKVEPGLGVRKDRHCTGPSCNESVSLGCNSSCDKKRE